MFRVTIFFSILSLGFFFIPNSASIFSGFENDKSCIKIENIARTKSVVVQKNHSLTVVSWNFLIGRWETSIGRQYKKAIDANSGTVEYLEFCFKNTSRHDSGYYEWRNDRDKKYTFQLQVWYGPTDIVISPKFEEFLTLDENQQQIINCSADCNPNCIITWKKGRGRNISTAKTLLLLNNVTESDSGNYTCLAENPKHKSHFLSKQFHISVQYGAKINPSFETDNELKEYGSTNISCRVNSNPLSNISWLKGNKKINTIYSAENEVVLHFENISCDDTGVYQCSAFNGIGQNDTKESMLNVFCKPRFIKNYFRYALEKKFTTSIGQEIKINVSLQANPTPQVVYNDFEIKTEFFRTSNTTFDVFLKKLVSSDNDFREHTLIISNSQGNVTIIIKAEKKRRKSGIIYGLVIGGTLSIALILISVLTLILTVNKRRQHHKDNLANSNSANNDETGGYRDNILYQSIDTISLQATDQSFDVSNSDSFDESIF